MLKKCIDVFALIMTVVSVFVLSFTVYTLHVWKGIYFEQIIINLQYGALYAGSDIVCKYALYAFLPALLSAVLIITKVQRTSYLLLISIASLFFSAYKLQMFEYIIFRNTLSDIYAKEYISPENISFSFPEKKRNLIVLFLESMEKNYADAQANGENLLPNLSKMAAENISFPGYHQISAQDYTIASLIMAQCAVPLKLLENKDHTELRNFLPFLTCYPQILKEQGYRNYFMKGAPLYFTRTGLFMQTHGFDDVVGTSEISKRYGLDLQTHRGTSWGFKDSTLYQLAKQRLSEIAAADAPFVFTLLTLDTHDPDIYLDARCPKIYGDERDIILCADKMAYDFIEWIKQQDFYPDTTIVISGDHTKTGENPFDSTNTKREILNIIINPAPDTPQPVNHQWTMLDLGPTILYALGIKTPDGRFGLGHSLFEEEPTLLEKTGSGLDEELKKDSKEYAAFNQIKYQDKEEYYDYPAYNTEINTSEEIQKYALNGDEMLNIFWLDTLSFTLPETNAENIKFDIQFRLLFTGGNSKNIEIFANEEKIADWHMADTVKQPVRKTLLIPKRLLNNDRKLRLKFKGDNIGYTTASLGLGVEMFAFSED